ncbi:phosphate acyltransferase PlsX [Lacihabitans sp. CS3-21]|jgi:glycerol-3-phosphate acyltransferase PlsX|uniref:phosphate acyltransferase PlsX n=1 Tax=Lacihabitans sp. CS3-21 TaxID=2487332 RepID=UPI000BD9AA47|nr:phosphate acyltransferase PlsX [Lacihabitans sp. CS3-21]MCP9748071.1 phosphate acyltransferase PlsX [Lacihabitans sp. CS3-21]MDP1816980.1 phosphate acyltransferase PlsX [Leadbetterella sp.]OYU65866.1 MAG: phosphate--acyl-ACP acyltransferase [Cytophagaceae bacterium BCCC1]
MKKIAVDAMGGDFAPKAVIEGAIMAASELPENYQIVLIGKQDAMLEVLHDLEYRKGAVEMIFCNDVIEMHEHPTRAFSQKPNSSIGVGFKLLKEGQVSAFCSAGNTGAMMVGSLFTLRTIGNLQRPPIAGYFPLKNGNYSLMLDIGANADCKPEVLMQFAELGSLYAKFALNIENPKVGLLNIGEEEEKGNTVAQAAYQLLKNNKKVNFIGNVEGRDLFDGKADVIVTDGFTGNVMFKMGESLYEYAATQGIDDQLINRMNYEVAGGSPIIGVNGNVIVGHGISTPLAIKNMILLAQRQIESNVVDKIKEVFL